jgi:Cu(I)/Ag(I) efflux system membrane fusion protein
VYSPELVNAQEEFVQALKGNNKALTSASRDRLSALGFSVEQISRLERKRKVEQRVGFFAPQDGVVSTLPVREGMYVKPSTRVMSLADLSTVWLLAEVFERQSAWVQVGQEAEVNLSYLPAMTWQGKVEYIYPSLDPKTRTLKVRLRFDNPQGALKPNMYANVRIYGGATAGDAVVIPVEAAIRTGRGSRVIVALGDGRFEARPVSLGIESGDWIEVVDGIEEGVEIVVSGQFLIDSEASARSSMMRMSAPAQAMPASRQVTGSGILIEKKPDQGMLNIEHDAIEQLGWPAMTMDFELDHGVDVSGVKKGDRVMFTMEERDQSYRITSIHRHDDHKPDDR